MEIGRREFLKLLGISGTAAVTGAWSAHMLLDIPEKVFTRIHSGSLVESRENSLCSLCPGGCGLRVRLIDGIPVRIMGNPYYPINRGSVCPLAESGIEYMFHPDRIRQPLKRTGPRGSDNWTPITWDEALNMVGHRLQNLLSRNEPEKLALITSRDNTLTTDLYRRFMDAFGSSGFFKTGYPNNFNLPVRIAQGTDLMPAFDFEHTGLVLNFDLDVLDAPLTPVYFNRVYGSTEARIIHFSSYRSRTAVRSTEWYPIKVGTGAALALGMANVIIRDSTYDHAFIRNHTFGFEDWVDSDGQNRTGFRQFVLTDYSPEKVAGLTGLAPGQIIDIARKFAETDRAFAIGGGQTTEYTNGVYTQYAIHALNALKGNLNREGGLLFPDRDYMVDTVADDDQQKESFFQRTGSFEHLLMKTEQEKSTIDTLLIHQSDPVSMGKRVFNAKKFLENIPFIVSIGSFMNESARLADLILPEPSILESWDASMHSPTVPYSHFAVQKPVIEKIDDTMQFGDFLLRLSKELGGNPAEKLAWKDLREYIRTVARSIYDTGYGTIVSESFDYSWVEFLKERGWQPMKYSSFREFWNLLLEHGGWWDPDYALKNTDDLFQNRTGKFEFYSSFLEKNLGLESTDFRDRSHGTGILNTLGIEARGDYVFLPHYEKGRPGIGNYPVRLLPFWIFGNWDQSGARLGMIQEMSGLHSREYWNPWAEINPDTAEEFGIHEDDYIDVITHNRSMTLKARVRPTVMPGSIVVPLGRFFGDTKSTIYDLLAPDLDRMSGIASMYSTTVRIRRSKHRDHA